MEVNIMAEPKATNISKTNRDYLNVPPVPASVWRNPLHFVAFGFGSGAVPFAPGTFGTLMAIPFYLVMQPLRPMIYLAVLLLVIGLSIWICSKATKDIGIDDHQGMCLDEIVGFLVTMFAAPVGWEWIAFGFVLFRIFDIWKPWPIRSIDRNIHGGFGMILDDVVAGVFSCLLLQAVAWIL
jgi:phosphatidylglycerophosphatase A